MTLANQETHGCTDLVRWSEIAHHHKKSRYCTNTHCPKNGKFWLYVPTAHAWSQVIIQLQQSCIINNGLRSAVCKMTYWIKNHMMVPCLGAGCIVALMASMLQCWFWSGLRQLHAALLQVLWASKGYMNKLGNRMHKSHLKCSKVNQTIIKFSTYCWCCCSSCTVVACILRWITESRVD